MPTPLVPPPRRSPGPLPPARITYASTHPPGAERSRRRRRRGRIAALAAAALVAAVTAVPAWHALTHAPGADGSTPTPVASAPTADPPAQSPAATPTADLTWVDHAGTPLPASASAGPARQDGPLDVGYADSDLGAALAAVHLAWAASPLPGPATFRAALAGYVVGEDRDELLVGVERDYAGTRAEAGLIDGAPPPPGDATVLGYRVTALPAGNRHVQIVVTVPAADGTPQVYATDVVMTRAAGDWRLVAPTGGTWDSAVSRLPDVPDDVVRFDPAQPPLGADR